MKCYFETQKNINIIISYHLFQILRREENYFESADLKCVWKHANVIINIDLVVNGVVSFKSTFIYDCHYATFSIQIFKK